MRKIGMFGLCLLSALTMLVSGVATSYAAGTCCRLAYTAKGHYGPQILALKKGWCAAPGVNVVGVNLGMSAGIAAAEALISGSADVAVMGDVPGLFALASARPCVLVASYGGGEGMHSIVTSPSAGIKSANDLVGKRLGVHFGSSTHGGVYLYLKAHGIDPRKVAIMNVPQKNLVEGLMSGSLDALAASEPTPMMALKKVSGTRLLDTLGGLGNDYPLVIVATKEFADAHPEAIKAVVQGTRKGVEYIKRDPKAAAADLSTITGASKEIEEASIKRLTWDVRLDDAVLGSLEQTAAFLQGIGKLKKVPDVRGLARPEFVR